MEAVNPHVRQKFTVVDALLKAGANPNVRDEQVAVRKLQWLDGVQGSSALHRAAERGHLTVVKALLKANAYHTTLDAQVAMHVNAGLTP